MSVRKRFGCRRSINTLAVICVITGPRPPFDHSASRTPVGGQNGRLPFHVPRWSPVKILSAASSDHRRADNADVIISSRSPSFRNQSPSSGQPLRSVSQLQLGTTMADHLSVLPRLVLTMTHNTTIQYHSHQSDQFQFIRNPCLTIYSKFFNGAIKT